MLVHDLPDQTQSDARTILLGGKEGYKYLNKQVFLDPGPIVPHSDLSSLLNAAGMDPDLISLLTFWK